MAEHMNAGRTQLVVKDWERILMDYGASIARIDLDGNVELFIVEKWFPITECRKIV